MVRSFNVVKRVLYDIRGADGTGTSANPVSSTSANAKAYTVRKLADGNCWMTDELALPLATGVTVEATHNTSATPYSYTPAGGCGTAANGDCAMNGNTLYSSTENQWYYSWYAANAGTNNTDSASAGVDSDVSICPVGWRLPANYSVSQSKSYGSITNAYLGIVVNNGSGSYYATLESYPLNFARYGYGRSGSVYHDGGVYYISSTTYTSNPSYTFVFYYGTSGIYPQGFNHYKFWGSSVRCVAL